MKKILTIIFDGFGLRDEEKGNAIKAANMETFNKFYEKYPHSKLYASEEYVGLMHGQMGNSEIGHMTIGAGRLIKSSIDSINDFFISNNENNEAYNKLLECKDRKIHLMGLCSDGNIHSSVNHFLYMYDLLVKNGFTKIYFHLITDGRDTKVDASYNYIKMISDIISEKKVGAIATICGRYYAMDRDENYDRTKAYYDLVTRGNGLSVLDIKKGIDSSYQNGITDEFIKPMLINSDGLIRNGDAIIWMNYRTDRAKQIISSFTDKEFSGFNHFDFDDLPVFSFLEIDKNINTNIFIPDEGVKEPLGIYLSKLGIKQARVAESEKYPHVTYFFDGGFNGKIPNVDKFHIPSPEVATYDLKPEMSAIPVTKKVIECMEKDYDFILVNYANPDMVGHTGSMEAATKACMALDLCLNKLIEKAEENFYTIILLADHGNADTMLNSDGSVCTTHSLEMVPFVISDPKIGLKSVGDLTNVAPTILDYMDISIPSEMTSKSILVE